jgi:hypothetical protein
MFSSKVEGLLELEMKLQRPMVFYRLSARLSLAVRFRSAQGEEQDVKVANYWQKECMMNANLVRNRSVRQGNNCSAYNRHDKQSRTISCQSAKFSHAQRKNAGEHDGVEEPDQNDAPHGDVTRAQHGNDHEHGRGDRADAEQ